MSVFDEAVAASRLADVIAPFTMTRLLVRADVSPRTLTREELAAALPTIEEGLRVYLGEEALRAAVEDLRRVAAGAS